MKHFIRRIVSLILILSMTSNIVLASERTEIDLGDIDKFQDIEKPIDIRENEILEKKDKLDSLEKSENTNTEYENLIIDENNNQAKDNETIATIKTSELGSFQLDEKIKKLIEAGEDKITVEIDSEYEIKEKQVIENRESHVDINFIQMESGEIILPKIFQDDYLFQVEGIGKGEDSNLKLEFKNLRFGSLDEKEIVRTYGIISGKNLDISMENTEVLGFYTKNTSDNPANNLPIFKLEGSRLVFKDNNRIEANTIEALNNENTRHIEGDPLIKVYKSIFYIDEGEFIISGNDNRFIGNATGISGGVVSAYNSKLTIDGENILFEANKSGKDANEQIDENSWSNESSGEYDGGAIWAKKSEIYIKGKNIKFINNSSAGDGGAIYNHTRRKTNFMSIAIMRDTISKIVIDGGRDILFDENIAIYEGGAMSASNLEIKNSSVIFNSNKAFNGGALLVESDINHYTENSILFKGNLAKTGASIFVNKVDYKDGLNFEDKLFVDGSVFLNNLSMINISSLYYIDTHLSNGAPLGIIRQVPDPKVVLRIHTGDDFGDIDVILNDYSNDEEKMNTINLDYLIDKYDGARFNLDGSDDSMYRLSGNELNDLFRYLGEIYSNKDLDKDRKYLMGRAGDNKPLIDTYLNTDPLLSHYEFKVGGHLFIDKIPDTKIKIIFDANGGGYSDDTKLKIKNIDKGTRVEKLSESPRRSGYSFTGWKEFGASKDFDFETILYSDKTLYAQWDRDSGGGREKPDPKPEPRPEPIKPPKEPEKDRRDRPIGKVLEPKIEFELNKIDHLAYLKGYEDVTLRSEGNLTREEAAIVFYRLMDPEFRDEVLSTKHEFIDVSFNRWSNRAIATLANAKMVDGYSDKTFKPEKPITRAELSRMIAKLTDTIVLHTEFVDIMEHWAEDYINTAKNKGWLKGYQDGTFKPDNYIKRNEFATVINSLLDRKIDRKDMLDGRKSFTDFKDDNWYYEIMTEAINGHKYKIEDGKEVWTELDNREFE